jgi:DNA-binding CsgD family transcriptional regulator
MARPLRHDADAEYPEPLYEPQNVESTESATEQLALTQHEPISDKAQPEPLGTEGNSSAPLAALSKKETPRDVLVALTYGLELVRHGAMLVAAGGRPHFVNRTALAILEKKDGISLARTGLVADRAADTRLLHKLLQEAIASPESGEPKESPMSLQRKTARTSLVVRIVPGPGLSCWDAPTAMLKLYDRDLSVVVDEQALSSLYGLTRGEATLAALLMQGLSLDEAAAQLFISSHTARTHLKRIFMKTDTHRQTELVVRMMLTVI